MEQAKHKYVCWRVGKNSRKEAIQTKTIVNEDKTNILDSFNGILAFAVIVNKTIESINMQHDGMYMLCNDGSLMVYGHNRMGQLGLGYHTIYCIVVHWHKLQILPHDIINMIEQYTPYKKIINKVNIPITMNNNFNKVKLMSNGIAAYHKFIITQQNQIYGVGYNYDSQLGIVNNDDMYRVNNRFSKINYFSQQNVKIKQIECCVAASTFLSDDGDIYVCGRNNGLCHSMKKLSKPKQIMPLTQKITKICCGCEHTLAISINATLFSWGSTIYGQCGDARTIYSKPEPIENVYFLNNGIVVADICCGYQHSLVLDSKHNVYTFGRNDWCQCGDGTKDNVYRPCLNKTLQKFDVIDIKCGYQHNVVKTKDNNFYVWGYNEYKQCLVFDDQECVSMPVKLSNIFDINQEISIYPSSYETVIIIQQS